ncbi:MAG: TspO/MBR family protein [Gammaproteobacteria bacterium]|nr:TspO/MBR family protein [Gammaproteobacteria bacterium]
MEPTRHRDLKALAVFLGICLVVYAANGLVTAASVGGWYQALEKPPFNPPDWLFGPIWTLLFVFMAVAGWRVWRSAPWPTTRPALVAWALQLGLNFTWSCLFFGLQAIAAALVEIIILLVAIITTMGLLWRHDRVAGLLFLPYIAWVGFATVLNAALYTLN